MKYIFLTFILIIFMFFSCSPIITIDGYSLNSITVNVYNYAGEQQVTVNGITRTVDHEYSWHFTDLSNDTITINSSLGFNRTYNNIPKSYTLNIEITL